MNITLLKCKIHRATVTEADLNYEGSISIDRELVEAAGLREFERVEIYNCNNGQRFATYVIYGSKGQICLNGAAARMVHKGDLVIIAAYAGMDEKEASQFRPKLIFVDDKNRIKSINSSHKTREELTLDN
jgi:aspartate 1-decarboxylase